MTRWQRGLFVVGITAALAACADQAPPPLPAPPLARGVGVDGAYNGIMRLTTGDVVACGTQDVFNLTVRGRAFRYVLEQPQVPWQQQRVFEVTITEDGSFRNDVGPAYIIGTVSQGHMQGQIVGDACGYVFEADTTGTF